MALLRTPTQKRDGQVEHLIGRLDHLRREIDRAGENKAVGAARSRTEIIARRPTTTRRATSPSRPRSGVNLSSKRVGAGRRQ
jgi:hypothetical protein